MPFIPVKREWTSKPPVGTPLRSDGHWSVRGLVKAFPFNEAGGSTCSGVPIGGNIPTWSPIGLHKDDSSAQNISLGNVLPGKAELTIVISQKRESMAGVGVFYSGAYTGGYWQNSIVFTPSGELFWYTRDSSTGLTGARNNDLTTSAPAIGLSEDFAFVYSVSGASKAIYKKGSLVANSSTSIDVLTTGWTTENLFYDGGETNRTYVGDVEYVYFYTRALSSVEIKSISANPWQIYEPETVWITVGGSGGQIAAFLDSAALSEAIAATVIRLASSIESIAVTTAESATLTTSVSATETSVVGESLSAGALITSATIEVIAASEASVSIKVTSSVLAESTGAGEVFAATKATSSTLTETSLTSEVISATKATISIIAESSGATETLSATFAISSSTTESVSPADTLSAIVGGIMAACTDSLSLSETQAVTLASSAAIGEAGITSDANTAIAQRPVAVSELSALSDLRGGIISTGAAISEATGATDEQNTLSITDAAIAESGATADNLTVTITTAGSGISWELMVAAVQAGLTAQGLTISRLAQIDNLDAPVSTRATPADVPAATVNAAAVWAYKR